MAGKKNKNAMMIVGATPGVVLGLVAFIISLTDTQGFIVAFIIGFIVFAVLAPLGAFLALFIIPLLVFVGHVLHIHSLEQLQPDDDIPEKKEEFFDSIERMLSPIYTSKIGKIDRAIIAIKKSRDGKQRREEYLDRICLDRAKKFAEFYKYSSKQVPAENSEYDKALKNWFIFQNYDLANEFFQNSIEKEESCRKLVICDYVNFISQTEGEEQAVRKLEEYIKLYGQKTEFFEKAVTLYSQTNNLEKLQASLNRLINDKSDPNREQNLGRWLLRRADCEYRLGYFEKSIETAKKAYDAKCWKVGYAKQIVDSYIAIGKYDEAKKSIDKKFLFDKIYSILTDRIRIAEKNSYNAENRSVFYSDDEFVESVMAQHRNIIIKTMTPVDEYTLKFILKKIETNQKDLDKICERMLTAAYITKHLYGKTEKYYEYISKGLFYCSQKYKSSSYCLSAIKASTMIKDDQIEEQALRSYFLNVPKYALRKLEAYVMDNNAPHGVYSESQIIQIIKYSRICRKYYESKKISCENIDKRFDDAERKFKDWLDAVRKNADFKEDLKNAADEVKNSVLTFDSDKEFMDLYIAKISKMDEFYKYDDFDNRNHIVSQVLNELKRLKSNAKDFNMTIFTENYLAKILSATIDNLEKITERTRNDFATKIIIDVPENKLSLDENNDVIFSVNISNTANRAPAQEMKLLIEDLSGKEIFKKDFSEKNLTAGASISELIKFNIKDIIKDKAAVGVRIKVSYKGGFVEMLKQLTIDSDDFEEIRDPYIAGSVVEKDKMFFGRDELIGRLARSLKNDTTRCVVIYGQKRSGKSSIFYHLKRKLEDKFIILDFTAGSGITSEQNFYTQVRNILSEYLEDNDFDSRIIEEFKHFDISEYLDFEQFLRKVNREICKPANKELLLMIDEFTKIYDYIKNDHVFTENFMDKWKAMSERNLFKSALIGQDNMPEFIRAYPNQFQVTELIRVSYLEKRYAIDLITKPILLSGGKNRYLEGAEEKIADWFNGQPFFIQKYCKKLVKYLDLEHESYITLAVAENVKNELLSEFMDSDFDNLVYQEESEDFWNVLKKIASSDVEDVPLDLSTLNDAEKYALAKLTDRDVITKKQDRYQIKIPFFREWIREYK